MISLSVILQQYNIDGADISIKQLASFTNEVYLITSHKTEYLLKKFSHKDREKLLNQQELVISLKELGISIPEIYRNREGHTLTRVHDTFYELSEYIPSKDASKQKDFYTRAGIQLAKLHQLKITRSYLPRFDYSVYNTQINKLIYAFKEFYQNMEYSPEHTHKIDLLDTFLNMTALQREFLMKASAQLTLFKSRYVLNHGDYNMNNLLISSRDEKLYIVDWDDVLLGPQFFEVQRAIGYLCCTHGYLGNIDAYNWHRVREFLRSYRTIMHPHPEDIQQLTEAFYYCYYIYWLRFILQQILKKDYRILSIFPDNLDALLYWHTHLQEYSQMMHQLLLH